MKNIWNLFLAALTSSGSLVVGPLVSPYTFVKKWPLQYQMLTITYLPSYLCDSIDGSDSRDSSDSNDSSDISNQTTLYAKKLNLPIYLPMWQLLL